MIFNFLYRFSTFYFLLIEFHYVFSIFYIVLTCNVYYYYCSMDYCGWIIGVVLG